MKKSLYDNQAYYTISWSRIIPYDRLTAARILPEMAGILCILEKGKAGKWDYILLGGCWRDGLRMGLRNFLDIDYAKYKHISGRLQNRRLHYKYTVVDSTPQDMQDILYWLIQSYKPELNALDEYEDSRRYTDINVREMEMEEGQIIEKIPRFGL
jgi:hypothetical protein